MIVGGVSVEDQIAQIHRQKGLMTGEPEPAKTVVIAPPAPAPIMVPPVAPMIVGVPMRPAMVVPAQVFAPPAMPAAPPIYIQPGLAMEDDEPEWKLEGQMLNVTLDLTETVNSVKSKIMDELGMPQGKQKLQHESIFLKDANSLAYYNIMPGTVLNLQLKEKGGRKK